MAGAGMSVKVIDQTGLRDIAEAGALDASGRLRILPAAFWRDYTQDEISAFCVRHGLYNVPTVQQLHALGMLLADGLALEIGAGNGVLAQALGIRAVDNHMQTWPEIAHIYRSTGQAAVTYGANVINADATAEVMSMQPDIVLGCWITHRYDPALPALGGNMYAPDERVIVKLARNYVHVGNSGTHRNKPIHTYPHRIYRPDWLVSRAFAGAHNEIRIWGPPLAGERFLEDWLVPLHKA